jgi:hypothetical protein
LAHETIELRGKKPPSSVVRPIPHAEYHYLRHVPKANDLGPVFAADSEHLWEDVTVLRADLDDYIKWVRELADKAI